jgi:hypothetical protein
MLMRHQAIALLLRQGLVEAPFNGPVPAGPVVKESGGRLQSAGGVSSGFTMGL